MNLRTLFSFQGRVDRTTYALAGIFGVLLKHVLDNFLAARFLHQPWGLLNYLVPLGMQNGPYPLAANQRGFLQILALTTLPFLWLGLSMTVKRLRDAGMLTRLVLFFFIPVVNIFFLLLLCTIPSRDAKDRRTNRDSNLLSAVLPKSKFGVALFSAIAGAVFGALLGWSTIRWFGAYGFTLFLAIPFFIGFLATWIYCHEDLRSFGQCAGVAVLSICLCGLIIIGIALDGLICVLMAAPIAIALAVFGAYLAMVVQSVQKLETKSGAVLGLFLAIPILASGEFFKPLPTPEFQTHTSIEISSPPDLVWKRIIAFPRIDAPLNPLFRVGISYPLEAQIVGSGLSADRKCIFSSGSFHEPILAWEQGKHFAFGVSAEPPLMKELSPYGEIRVRHLEDNDFRPLRADFYLTELPGGHTQLDGITTYQNRMWPAAYWRIWTDGIVHQIHYRVFRQVKDLAEADVIAGGNGSTKSKRYEPNSLPGDR